MGEAASAWRLALRNLSVQNTTTLLTISAIAICVMTFVSIFSILDGLQITIQTVMNRYYGERNVYVLTSQESRSFEESRIPIEVSSEYRSLPRLYGFSAEDIVDAEVGGAGVEIRGVDIEDLQRVTSFKHLEGRIFQGSGECLVGQVAADTLGIGIGDSIDARADGMDIDLTVVGVFETETPMDAQILVPRELLASLIPRFSNSYSVIRIRVQDPQDIDPVRDLTQSKHPELRVREARQVSKFFQKSIVNIARLLSTVIVFVILLMVLGIYNSMNMVVSERRWEIGVIRAMGARRAFIQRMFLAESAMLSLLGGLFGVGLGIAMSNAVTSFFSIFVPGSAVSPVTKFSTIGWAIVASLAIGLVGGVLPARNAAKLQISEALSEG